MRKNVESIFLASYAFIYVIFSLLRVSNSNKYEELMVVFSSKYKMYMAIIIISIFMSLVVFMVQYLVMRFVFNRLNRDDAKTMDNIGNAILLCDSNMMVISLIVLSLFTGVEKYLIFINSILGIILFFYLLKGKYQKKIVYAIVGVKILFYIVNALVGL